MHKNRTFSILFTLAVALSLLAGARQLPTRAQSPASGAAISPELLGQIGGGVTAATFVSEIEGFGYLYPALKFTVGAIFLIFG